MFKAIIFDFDGVILDSEPIHYEACCTVLEDIGLAITYEEYVEKYLGLSDKKMFPELLRHKGYTLTSDEIESIINKKVDRYIHIINNHPNLPIINDVEQYIVNAVQNTRKIAICTGSSKKEVLAVLTKVSQSHPELLFNTIVTSEDVQHGKPSPEGYLLTATLLGVTPDKCLVIEDSPYGVDAGKNAGMQVIALLTTHDRHHLQKADKIATGFQELLREEIQFSSNEFKDEINKPQYE